MTTDFQGLLRTLDAGGVEFVVVGGYSAMLHGGSQMTRDVDVVCPMHDVGVKKLHAALNDLHPCHRMNPDCRPFSQRDLDRGGWKNLYLRTDLGVLDCLGEVLGVGDYPACAARSIQLDLGGGLLVSVLEITALIEAKRALGRARDLVTAEELELIRGRKEKETPRE